MVTLERQVTSRNRLVLGQEGVASPIAVLVKGHPQTAATDSEKIEHPQSLPRGGEDERLNRTDIMETTRLVQTTLTGQPMNTMCKCGKVCKNLRGLRIHQAKSACGQKSAQQQRTGNSLSGETQEYSSQETTHSTGELYASGQTDDSRLNIDDCETKSSSEGDPLLDLLYTNNPEPPTESQLLSNGMGNNSQEKKQRIKWPRSSDTAKWKEFDNDMDLILQSSLRGSADHKLTVMTNLIFSVGKERFGIAEDRKAKTPYQPNRRQRQIEGIRKEIKALNKAYKKASAEEKLALHTLRDQLRSQIRTLRKAEQLNAKRRKRAKARATFVANPFKFSKLLLDKEKSGNLEDSIEDIQQYLKETHSDPNREDSLGDCPRLEPEPQPTTPLATSEPTFSEVKEVVKKARAGSAPGPNGIPYRVYKFCPNLINRLWRLLKVIWRKGKVPESWQQAEGIFAPKEKDSKHVSQFRTISLLNVEGKIFFAVLAKRLTTYLVANNYIDTSVQKGGVPGFSGCVEHTSAISQLIREAKVNSNDLTVVWLDLANAYGSIPHKVIQTALEHYHIPGHIQGIINGYLGNIQLRFTVGKRMTAWQRLEKGIVTGCTISVILFVMGMNLILNAAKKETRGPKTDSGIYLPASRGFMDDLTITTKSHIQARWILTALEETANWARMKFKPKKSRSLVIRKGKTTRSHNLQVQGEDIPTIMESPIKCLGKWFDASLKDTNNIQRIHTLLQEGLKTIDKTCLPGKFKAWLFQHGLLPRLMWPLMLYEIATSTVEKLERSISRYLRHWLGVPPSFSNIGLYGKSNQLQLPLSSLVEEFKVAKARLVVTLKESKDELVRKAGIQTRTGRKWSASQAVSQAESRLRHKDIVGTTNTQREGLGIQSRVRWCSASSTEKRQLVQDEIRLAEEEERTARAVAMSGQGAWTKWSTTNRKLTWSDIWNYEPLRLKFLLRSVYDLLPSPANLHRWGLQETPTCPLCDKTGTLEHVLSSCRTCLTQGRYRWRHDCILRDLADVLERERTKKRAKQKPKFIQFVKEGQTASRQKHHSTSVLDESDSWEMSVDLGKKLVFPDIVQTMLRPDIVIWSVKDKCLAIVELTVPWESRCDEAFERKKAKYTELLEQCKTQGWKSWLFPVEIGTRGFPAQSLWRMLSAMGVKGANRKRAVQRLSTSAERASSWLWFKRQEMSWKPTTNTQ